MNDALQGLQRVFRRRHVGRDAPWRRGAAVAVGVAVGLTPLYGLHLVLCLGLAHLLGLSRLRTYLAAHLNNPLTLPFILWAELGLGHRLFEGRWPRLSLDHFREAGAVALSRDLVAGTVLLTLLLAPALGAVAWLVARARPPSPFARLRDAVAERYLGAGLLHLELVRGKLRHDPMYRHLLEAGLLPRPGRLVDLGCGRGILLTLLAVHGAADPGVPDVRLTGIELRERHVRAARHALGDDGEVRQGDLTAAPVPPCDTAVLLDVLHYLPAADQERLLARVAGALAPGGVLIVRDADAAAGWRFALTRAAERFNALARGHLRQRFHYRSRDAWTALLRDHGLTVDTEPLSAGTPFGNVLLVARRVGRVDRGRRAD